MTCVVRLCMLLLLFGIASSATAASSPRVLNGIDVLRASRFRVLSGKRVGLITNHTGRAADGKTTIELLFRSDVCELVALFSPEHGITGTMDEEFGSSTDHTTSLPVYSLYGAAKRPTPAMLKNIDALVFDIQDVGARFYTYITTMAYCMEEASKARIPFYVLDRPNPIGGNRVQGPMLDPDKTSFVGYMPLPVRHGMTVGELARYFNIANRIGVELHVIEMEGWARSYYFWDTGQVFRNPSPNLRNMVEVLLYPGVCLLEFTNVSVGRGTDRPFEVVGAPWIDPYRLATELETRRIPGVKFVPMFFTPDAGRHKGTDCGGVNLLISNTEELDPVFLGLSLISTLRKLYPDAFEIARVMDLLGNAKAMKELEQGKTPSEVLRNGRDRLRDFMEEREKVLIYGESPRSKKGRD
ncbi:MAG: DUF1343 domain-containing protein [Acidobacteria bacterium]|nr:DUF1343 domain-containing protein [Acidobacteriota bacterium]